VIPQAWFVKCCPARAQSDGRHGRRAQTVNWSPSYFRNRGRQTAEVGKPTSKSLPNAVGWFPRGGFVHMFVYTFVMRRGRAESVRDNQALSGPRREFEGTLISLARVHRLAVRYDHVLERKVKEHA
jgi:hypothetical protein